LPLIYIQERAGGPELIGGNHELAGSDSMRIEYIYTIRTTVSSINLNAQDIIDEQRFLKQILTLSLHSKWKMQFHTSVYRYQLYETMDRNAFFAFGFGFFRLCL
jgi:hypothetical protein